MPAGDRFKGWIDNTAVSFSDRLKDWIASVLSFGFDVFFRLLARAASPKFKKIIERLEATGEVPPEIQPLLDELKSPTGEAAAFLVESAGSAMMGSALGTILDAILLPVAYAMNSATQYVMPDVAQLLGGWLRGSIPADMLPAYLHRLGYENTWVKLFQDLARSKLDPHTVITAWRRDPEKYAKFFKDITHQGFDFEQIDAMKTATQAFPSLSDIVMFYAREAFEPDMISRYGLKDELPPYEGTLFEKVGVPKEIADLYWIAHWEHASWNQVVEMLHRGQLTYEEVYEWFRVVEIPPYWRDKLINISYNVPTRVDVRRFYDLRTIDEARLREIYANQGYHGKDLDDYVLWTKIYVDLPDLLARWKNGWISLDEVRSSLIADGMKPDAADELIQTKVKAVEPSSTAEGKELTKTEIYKGVKQGILTYDQGVDLLMDLDYSRDQADYLLITNVAVLTGSPETYSDFKDITQKYRKAAGLESKPVPEKLKAAANDLVRITNEIEELKRTIAEEERTLVKEEVLPKSATERLDELKVTLHRAEAALAEAQSRYNQQVAIFRHAPPESKSQE